MANSVRESLLSACRLFMTPVARFLIQNGITYKEFAETAKAAFVDVASEDYGIRGRQTNVSRTAVLTGMTRKEVKKIREQVKLSHSSPREIELNRPAKVLSVWNEGKAYLDSNDSPRVLTIDGPNGFRDLLREVGGDVPPGAMLTELIRAGCVEEVSDGRFRCIRRQFNPSGISVFQATRFGECLRDLADTVQWNLGDESTSEKRFEFRVWNDRIPKRRIPKFEQFVRESGSELLEVFDRWLMENQTQLESISDDDQRCGVGMYFFRS
ncbi:MAG: DUF6502 family protein [Gammaproteobacteria bacterium]